eukprot:TRINITY_DN1555_c1_g1_i2.p1 TRINITY_DN1555_c1_g1~~TRINITY_DN1555_c1_g1_i2.p1  ORF type:complete len:1255 (+),score=287.94 TRINITY_DN1555_c1_g1_i2:114-3878(+)
MTSVTINVSEDNNNNNSVSNALNISNSVNNTNLPTITLSPSPSYTPPPSPIPQLNEIRPTNKTLTRTMQRPRASSLTTSKFDTLTSALVNAKELELDSIYSEDDSSSATSRRRALSTLSTGSRSSINYTANPEGEEKKENEEEEEKDDFKRKGPVRFNKTRRKVGQMLDNTLFTCVTLIATLFVLYIDDLLTVSTPVYNPTGDAIVVILKIICMGLFASEMAALCYVRRRNYVPKLMFWLDLLAILAIIPDILLALQINSIANAQDVIAVTRAVRVIRAIARLGRLLRVVRFYMVFTRRKRRRERRQNMIAARQKALQRANSVHMEDGEDVGHDDLDASPITEYSPEATRIGSMLIKSTTTKVIVVVLLMAVVSVVLNSHTYFNDEISFSQSFMVTYETATNQSETQPNIIANAFVEFIQDALNKSIIAQPNILQVDINGIVLYNNEAVLKSRRPIETQTFRSISQKSKMVYDLRSESVLDSALSMVSTSFIIFLFISGNYFIVEDCKSIVIEPFEKVMGSLRSLAYHTGAEIPKGRRKHDSSDGGDSDMESDDSSGVESGGEGDRDDTDRLLGMLNGVDESFQSAKARANREREQNRILKIQIVDMLSFQRVKEIQLFSLRNSLSQYQTNEATMESVPGLLPLNSLPTAFTSNTQPPLTNLILDDQVVGNEETIFFYKMDNHVRAGRLKYATKEKLIEWLTRRDSIKLDSRLISTFLLLYRSFMTPAQLLDWLIVRYCLTPLGTGVITNNDLLQLCGIHSTNTDETTTTDTTTLPQSNSDKKDLINNITNSNVSVKSTSDNNNNNNNNNNVNNNSSNNLPPLPPHIAALEEKIRLWRMSAQGPIRISVYCVLKQWMVSHFYDFASSPTLLQSLKDFVSILMSSTNLRKQADQLSLILERRLKLIGNEINENGVNSPPFQPPSPLSLSFLGCDIQELQRVLIEDSQIAQLDRIPVGHLALQLTLIEFGRFRAIQPQELLGQAWSKKNKETRAPNVLKVIYTFNTFSSWVKTCIVRWPDPRYRVHWLKKMVVLAEELVRLNNFATVMEIVAALESAPIFRLKGAFKGLSPRDNVRLSQVKLLMSADDNFKAYRESLKTVNSSSVPYLGLFLSDLTFLDDGNPEYITLHEINKRLSNSMQNNNTNTSFSLDSAPSNNLLSASNNNNNNNLLSASNTNGEGSGSNSPAQNLVNFEKHWMIASVIEDIIRFQRTPYNIEPDPNVIKVFEDIREYDDDILYKLSLLAEPRKAKTATTKS